jgi:hypothetical protein
MTFLDPSFQEIISIIRNGVDVGELTVRGLTSLTPEILGQSIREWQDPLLIVEWLKLENPFIAVIAKPIFRSHWEHVEFVLTDGEFLYNEVVKDKDKKKLLDTPRGTAWLNYVRRRSYEYYFWYTWGKKCPRCAKNMDRIKTKDVRNITNEIYLCKCKYKIPIFDEVSTYHENQGNALQLGASTTVMV